MNSVNPISPKRRYKNGVMAALEICDARRAQETGLEPAAQQSNHNRMIVDRTAAIVDAAAARIAANDYTALETICASQVLALDVAFNQFARESAQWKTPSHHPMLLALKAQSQCRATLKTLVSLSTPKKNREIPPNELFKSRILSNEELLAVPPWQP
jgi:hypothetical protein